MQPPEANASGAQRSVSRIDQEEERQRRLHLRKERVLDVVCMSAAVLSLPCLLAFGAFTVFRVFSSQRADSSDWLFILAGWLAWSALFVSWRALFQYQDDEVPRWCWPGFGCGAAVVLWPWLSSDILTNLSLEMFGYAFLFGGGPPLLLLAALLAKLSFANER